VRSIEISSDLTVPTAALFSETSSTVPEVFSKSLRNAEPNFPQYSISVKEINTHCKRGQNLEWESAAVLSLIIVSYFNYTKLWAA
jgi:hypothetical protein